MISMEAVRAEVERRWSEQFVAVPTAYAEQTLASDRLPAWAELWITPLGDQRRRRIEPDRLDVTITVHVFVRDVDAGRLTEQLLDLARGVLQPMELLTDAMRVATQETSIRDLSRAQADEDGGPVRHVVLIARAIADERVPC